MIQEQWKSLLPVQLKHFSLFRDRCNLIRMCLAQGSFCMIVCVVGLICDVPFEKCEVQIFWSVAYTSNVRVRPVYQ